MAFLTVWSYLVLTLYLVTTAITTVVHHLRQDLADFHRHGELQNRKPAVSTIGLTNTSFTDSEKQTVITSDSGNRNLQEPQDMQNSDQVTWYMKTTWVLADVVYVFSLIVTVVYFTALFPLIGKTNFIDLNVHGLNSVFVLVDAFLVARPVRLLHVLYPFIYGAIYLVFSTIYWSTNKEVNVLYPGVLDWNHPAQTAVVITCLCLIGLPLLQLFHFGIYRLRLHIFRKIYDVEFEDL